MPCPTCTRPSAPGATDTAPIMHLDTLTLGSEEHEVWLERAPGAYRVHAGTASVVARLDRITEGGPAHHRLSTEFGDEDVLIAIDGDRIFIHMGGADHELTHLPVLERLAHASHGAADDQIRAPMPGTVISVDASPGQAVTRGQALMVMESMKLETTVSAPRDGVLKTIHVAKGQTFDRDALLIEFEPAEGTA